VSSDHPFAFLSPAAAQDVALRTPMERNHRAAGAEIEQHDGWRIATYPPNGEAPAWLADLSHHGKIDVRGPGQEIDSLTGGSDLGHASHVDGVWTLRLSPTHAIVLCQFGRVAELRDRIASDTPALCVVDMTCGWAAAMIGGEHVREVFMRSSSLDVRPHRFPSGACMAGSVMRCGSIILNDDGRFWVLCGWEFGEYMWESLLDAGQTLGIAPVSAAVALGSELAA
jgi:sarcosine oxidase gamma subunit